MLFLALAPMQLGSCVDRPAEISTADIKDVLAITIKQSRAKFGPRACFQTDLPSPEYMLPPSNEWKVVSSGLRQRILRPKLPLQMPTDLLTGVPITSTRFGCPETVRTSDLEFSEVEQQGKRFVLANTSVWLECGPLCGTEYSLSLIRQANGWELYENWGLQETGVMS